MPTLSSPYICRSSAGKRTVNESLGCPLEQCALLMSWCLNFNVFPFVRPTHRHHDRDQARSQLQKVWHRMAQLRSKVRFFESCGASSSCIFWHTWSRSKFLVSGSPLTFLWPPRSDSNRFSACIFTILHRDNFVDTCQNVPIRISSRLAVSTRSSGRYPPLTSSQNPPPSFKI